jgi:hypothetical protein
MKSSIDVTLCRTHDDKPLVVVHDSPLNSLDLDLTPEQLRAIASALLKIANEAEQEYGSQMVRKRSYRVVTDVDRVA